MPKTITEQQARRLAVTYSSYNGALDCRNRAAWGLLLQEAQHDTGIQLVPDWMLRRSIHSAEQTTARIEQACAALDRSSADRSRPAPTVKDGDLGVEQSSPTISKESI